MRSNHKIFEVHKNCEWDESKKTQEFIFVVSNWSIKLLFLFFSISSVFIIFHSQFWLSVITRPTMQQRTNSLKPSNINKIIIPKSWWNQDMAPYTIFQQIIEFGPMSEPQVPLATCKIPFLYNQVRVILLKFKYFWVNAD